MKIDEVIKYYGSGNQLELITGITRPNVNYWRKVGHIPIAMQHRIEKLSCGKLKANILDCGHDVKHK